MAIQINIASIDRTSLVQFGSVSKKDALNQTTDTLNFTIVCSPTQTFRPETNSDVTMYDGATKVFGGKIYSVVKSSTATSLISYQVKCKDYSYDLGRQLVVEGYSSMTVNDIITAILTNYTDGTFTNNNVNCDLLITTVVFDRVTVMSALQRLAELTNFSWYVDYDKDIHFFEKNTELAPFNITDGDGNAIHNTLQITEDFSQIRNRVYIKGGKTVGSERTETFNGDGTKLSFKLANQFSNLPTVTVGGVAQTVGLDFLDDEASHDCFWNFEQSYIRFAAGTVPAAGTNNVSVTGTPLFTLVVEVENPESIAEYGVFEYSKTDLNITSREEAVALAKTELQIYKDGINEGRFDTYTSGLRSGQVINVTSVDLAISEDFVIQSTSYKMVSETTGLWNVALATLRTVSMVDFLVSLLQLPGKLIKDNTDTVLEKTVFTLETIVFADVVEVNTNNEVGPETLAVDDNLYVQALDFPAVFVAGPYTPTPSSSTDYQRVFILDGSPLA